jgi:hypothetical protein
MDSTHDKGGSEVIEHYIETWRANLRKMSREEVQSLIGLDTQVQAQRTYIERGACTYLL